MSALQKNVQKLLSRVGLRLQKLHPLEYEKEFLAIREKITDFTMTSLERQHSLYDAVKYVANNNIEGDIVECGVWRGGSSMLAALTLKELGQTNRKLYLYDTYAGMSEPTDNDVTTLGEAAGEKWKMRNQGEINTWDYASLDDVQNNMRSTGYPEANIIFEKGKVEDTIPATMPTKIALLRLDTDWYESTKHELEHLFPLLVKGGVLILDDYGHWEGARKAVDEYFKEKGIAMLLNRIDYTGRIGIK